MLPGRQGSGAGTLGAFLEMFVSVCSGCCRRSVAPSRNRGALGVLGQDALLGADSVPAGLLLGAVVRGLRSARCAGGSL